MSVDILFKTSNAESLTVVAGFFAFQCAFLVTQAIWMTEMTYWMWRTQAGYQPAVLSIAQVLCTVVSDALLILLPIWIFHTAKLDSGLRLRLLAVLSMSLTEMLAGIAQAVISSVVGGLPSLLCGIVKVTSMKYNLIPVRLIAFVDFCRLVCM